MNYLHGDGISNPQIERWLFSRNFENRLALPGLENQENILNQFYLFDILILTIVGFHPSLFCLAFLENSLGVFTESVDPDINDSSLVNTFEQDFCIAFWELIRSPEQLLGFCRGIRANAYFLDLQTVSRAYPRVLFGVGVGGA